MVRVILGRARSGKTTLARQLGECTGLPVCLDAIWLPHWEQKDVPALRTLIEKAHTGDEWISDGNFALATFDIRRPRATLVIWLEVLRLACNNPDLQGRRGPSNQQTERGIGLHLEIRRGQPPAD
jgi:adenylate kinase family enzyme